MERYFGEFSDKEDVIGKFEYITPADKQFVRDAEVICAAYTYADYEGSAFVLLRKDDQLYEVNGGHCSCNGLQEFELEPTSREALMLRNTDGYYGAWGKFGKEMREIISQL